MKNEEILNRVSRFTQTHIMGVLLQVEGGLALAEIGREYAISSATLYKWRAKFDSIATINILRAGGLILRPPMPSSRNMCQSPYPVRIQL